MKISSDIERYHNRLGVRALRSREKDRKSDYRVLIKPSFSEQRQERATAMVSS
jgi:hypothetical protein